MPMMPAAREDRVPPRTAPRAPYPRNTRSGAAVLFTIDWHISVRLLNCIFSKPMKLDWDAFSSDPANMVMEAIDIKDDSSGL